MKFSEILTAAREWLQRERRLRYRSLKREFTLDDETLEDLRAELIESQRVAVDENGEVLVWIGKGSPESKVQSPESKTAASADPRRETLDPSPISYTPPHLAERIRAEQTALAARGNTDGERKTITALFADLKGSTALIEGLDPEEARTIIDPALQLMMDAVHRYEGYVAQALGDGIFALFGAPLAHEDHPQRALYAALRMQERMRRYADTLREKGHPPLLMRVGVNTGEVVVRSIRKDDLHTDYVPIGLSTNLAARMEQLAAPGSILITEHTLRLTEGYFEFKALGKTQIKGVEDPLHVYEVLSAGPPRTRLQIAATSRGLTRFIGRQRELGQLRQRLVQATTGQGQIVGVMGEPGLGKSRLFYEFKLLAPRGCLVLEAYSVSHGKASPYLPLMELLKSYFQIQLPDDDRTRREKVIGKVLGLDRSLEETLPYLFALFGLDDSTSFLQQMDPQVRRRRTFEAIKKLFLRESLNQPLMLIFEDLHWIDSETQGFLDTLSEGVASAKILLLVNYRPEYRHEWGTKTYYTQLRLAPFGTEEAEEFLTMLLGNEARLHSLKQLILQKTEGTPFFMEEVVQELVEQGALVRASGGGAGFVLASTVPVVRDFHIPTTVQGVLAARIDRLPAEEKELLQQLAIIGREFTLSLVTGVIGQSDEAWYPLLAALQRKEFLYEQPAFPEVHYLFKHALTQEVAYNSVLHERRKAFHERTAQAMEVLYRATLDEHYSELAHHYQRSGNTEKAIGYLQKAGQQAVLQSAHADAVTHLTTALDMLMTLPETAERAQQELTLLLALATPLMVAKGAAAPEVGAVRTRALDLCRQVGETPQLFGALRGACGFYFMRGELQTAQELAERLIPLAQHAQDSTFLSEAHYISGVILHSLGEVISARAHLEQALALYDPRQRDFELIRGDADHGVMGSSAHANVLWMLGYPNQALSQSRTALTLAQEMAHPLTTAAVWFRNMMSHQFLHDAQTVQQQAEALFALSNERGYAAFLIAGLTWRGWALAEQGQAEDGIQQIQQGIAAARAKGIELFGPHLLALLAEAYGKTGQVEEGLNALAEAVMLVEKNEERMYEAELYRLKGGLTLAQSKVQSLKPALPAPVPQAQVSVVERSKVEEEAEGCFLKAIEIACKQQAKSLELRAVTSLVRLRQQQVQNHAPRNTHETR